jgi:hypothetical protein
MSDQNTLSDTQSSFSYGVSELRRANAAQTLRLAAAPPKAAKDHRGVDPYNTSGSFDRKKNWLRVGKR